MYGQVPPPLCTIVTYVDQEWLGEHTELLLQHFKTVGSEFDHGFEKIRSALSFVLHAVVEKLDLGHIRG